MMPLRSITAYNGWLILEHSETVGGKLKARFSVQQPPDGPIQAGHSLKEAKQAIDHSGVKAHRATQRGAKRRPDGSVAEALPSPVATATTRTLALRLLDRPTD